ncbi:MAG: hypothetical protein HYV14_00505 [Elusimicrobia bacterium]|nr:hypothetical protein [Elusimicrobiota bacterium]
MSQRLLRAAVIAVSAAAAAAAPVRAQMKLMAEPDSEWESVTAPGDPGSTPDTPIGPTTPEGGFSAPERVTFGEKMRERVLDQLCRNVKLKYDYNLPGDFGGTGAGFKRWLAPLPDGRLTIVDEERLSVGYGHGFSKVVSESVGVAVGLWVGGRIEGSSMVIRPLAGKATCKEIDTLVDLRDIKTILPFKASRVSAMQVGELWRMPFRLTVGHTESIGDALAENLNLSFSFNGTEAGAATLTVYRLSESQLRFRYRVDRVEIRTRGGSLVQTIPAVEFASLGTNILANLVDHELAKQLRRYTVASLGFSNSRSQGKRVMLEYVVDPRDPAQAEAVAQALHGDFRSLARMGWRMGTQQATDESTEAAYLRMKDEHDKELGPAQFAAIDAYTQKAKSITLNLPFLTAQNWSSLRADNTTTRYTDEQGHIHFERADKSRQSEYFNIPWVGPLVKDQVQRDVQVVTAARAGEEYGAPIVVYLQQHGFLRATESSVREKAKELSEIMALAGTRGNGPNPRLAVPVDKHFPEPPAPEPSYDFDRHSSGNQEPANRKGAIAFTLVFNQEGVKQLTAATAEDVIRSYTATVDSIPAAKWLLANGALNPKNGKVEYDWRAAREAFPDRDDTMRGGGGNRSYEEGEIEHMAKVASGLIADLASARDAKDNESRSAALAKAFAGLGESGLPYDEALRVFVQLVDPMNLTADFTARVDRPKKEGDLALHFALKKGRPDNKLLQLAGEAKSRFAEPSILVD